MLRLRPLLRRRGLLFRLRGGLARPGAGFPFRGRFGRGFRLGSGGFRLFGGRLALALVDVVELELRNQRRQHTALAVRQITFGLLLEHRQDVYRSAGGVQVTLHLSRERIGDLAHLLHRRGVKRVHYREEQRLVLVETVLVGHKHLPLTVAVWVMPAGRRLRRNRPAGE